MNRDFEVQSSFDRESNFGLDVKYGLTPSLTLDATYNTDFAQVEADQFQINLDRFNLRFPEKRDFFLENAGYFGLGDPGTHPEQNHKGRESGNFCGNTTLSSSLLYCLNEKIVDANPMVFKRSGSLCINRCIIREYSLHAGNH